MGVAFVLMGITNYGGRLPYIRTENSFEMRAYVILPAILFLFFYFIFIHKWQETGKSGFDMATKAFSQKERIKTASLALAAMVLGSACFSWLSCSTVASVAYLAANQPYV